MDTEYDEGLATLSFPAMVYYKFLSTFHVDDTTLSFGVVKTSVPPDVSAEFRSYLKGQKRWVRDTKRPPRQEIRQRMWWIVQKIVDAKVFTESQQKYIMCWQESCDSQMFDL